MKRTILLVCILLVSSVVCSAQQFTYYYPQIASGIYSEGFWQTTIFVTNANAIGSGAASGSITFTRDDGTPYNMTWVDERGQQVASGNVVPFQLSGGETRRFTSVADGPLSTGFATVTATGAVTGTAVFTQFDSGGRMLGEAGVPAAIPLGKQAILVDTLNGFKTGFAIANPNAAPLNITFQLVNDFGQIVGTSQRSVPPHQHFSAFIHEMFPASAPMVGRLQFWCMNPMAAVGLRFDPSFALFTTLPPLAVQ
jgi:hypothetical protein